MGTLGQIKKAYASRNNPSFTFLCATSFTMSHYCYSQLSQSDNIRLLRLMPYASDSTVDTELHCELFEHSLQDLGKGSHLYEALSYTWGGKGKALFDHYQGAKFEHYDKPLFSAIASSRSLFRTNHMGRCYLH